MASTAKAGVSRLVPHRHESVIPLGIVYPVRDGHACGVTAEVVVVHRLRMPLPTLTRVFETANQFLFLGIHADDGCPAGRELLALALDIEELAVAQAAGRWIFQSGFQPFAIAVQGELHLLQQAGYRTGAYGDAEAA